MSDEGETENSGADEEKLPSAGSNFEWLGYFLSVEFYPGIKTPRQTGASFSARLADAIEIERMELESNEWRFGGGGTCDGMRIVVEKQRLALGVNSPKNALDFYITRNHLILDAFKSSFSPDVILRSSAMASGLVDVDGDARYFIGGNLMLMHPKKFQTIERPLEILGIRMYFPPDQVNWGVDVKVESWADDPTKLWVHADADWRESRDWDEASSKDTVETISHVTAFMNSRLMAFLHQSPLLGLDDSEDDENGN